MRVVFSAVAAVVVWGSPQYMRSEGSIESIIQADGESHVVSDASFLEDAEESGSAPSTLCTDGDVRMPKNNGKPEIWYKGAFRPICGHWIWNNDTGARAICSKLGGSGGKVDAKGGKAILWKRANRYKLKSNGVFVGKCYRSDLTQCGRGRSKGLKFKGYCKAKNNAGFEIKCNKPRFSQSCATLNPYYQVTKVAADKFRSKDSWRGRSDHNKPALDSRLGWASKKPQNTGKGSFTFKTTSATEWLTGLVVKARAPSRWKQWVTQMKVQYRSKVGGSWKTLKIAKSATIKTGFATKKDKNGYQGSLKIFKSNAALPVKFDKPIQAVEVKITPTKCELHCTIRVGTLVPKACGKGEIRKSDGKCASCKKGEKVESNGVVCTTCAAGMQRSSKSHNKCEACPAGSYSNDDGGCKKCPAGEYNASKGKGKCQQCALGKTSDTGATSCKGCAKGKYSPVLGGAKCLTCPSGSFTSGTGHWKCACKDNNQDWDEGSRLCWTSHANKTLSPAVPSGKP